MGKYFIVAIAFLVLIVIVYWKPLSARHKVKVLERQYQEEREQLKPMYGVWMICYDEPLGTGGSENSGSKFVETMKHLPFAVNTAAAVLDAMEAQYGKKAV